MNFKIFQVPSVYTIWDGLSLKTISRYCPFKDNVSRNVKSQNQCIGTKQDMLFWPFKILSYPIKNLDLRSFLFWSQKNGQNMLSFLLIRQVFPIFYAFIWKFPTFSSRYIPFWPGDITKESHVCLLVCQVLKRASQMFSDLEDGSYELSAERLLHPHLQERLVIRCQFKKSWKCVFQVWKF